MNIFFIISILVSMRTPRELWGQNLSDRLKIDVLSILCTVIVSMDPV